MLKPSVLIINSTKLREACQTHLAGISVNDQASVSDFMPIIHHVKINQEVKFYRIIHSPILLKYYKDY